MNLRETIIKKIADKMVSVGTIGLGHVGVLQKPQSR